MANPQQQSPWLPPGPSPFGPNALPVAPPVTALDEGVAVTVVNAATATGASFSFPFTLPATGGQAPRSIDYQASGVYSVGTIQLQESMDGGTTWSNSGSAIDVKAQPAGNISPLVSGALYRFNVNTITGTSFTINVMPV